MKKSKNSISCVVKGLQYAQYGCALSALAMELLDFFNIMAKKSISCAVKGLQYAQYGCTLAMVPLAIFNIFEGYFVFFG